MHTWQTGFFNVHKVSIFASVAIKWIIKWHEVLNQYQPDIYRITIPLAKHMFPHFLNKFRQKLQFQILRSIR